MILYKFELTHSFDHVYGYSNKHPKLSETCLSLITLLYDIWLRKNFISELKILDQNGSCSYNISFFEVREDRVHINSLLEDDEEGEYDFIFPKEKFRQFLKKIHELFHFLAKYSVEELPSKIEFIIDENWDTIINPIFD